MPTTPTAEPFHGIVYRQCASDHTDLATTLAHSNRRGGRFNPPGEFGAIYVAVERTTALRELARHAAFIGFTVDELLPRTMLCLRMHVRRSGYEAIEFRSATGTGVCLAVFADRMSSGSSLDVADAVTITTVDD